jgi:hypothetical protein
VLRYVEAFAKESGDALFNGWTRIEEPGSGFLSRIADALGKAVQS